VAQKTICNPVLLEIFLQLAVLPFHPESAKISALFPCPVQALLFLED